MDYKSATDFLLYIFKNWKIISQFFKKKKFLNENPKFLIENYDDEVIIEKEIPYVLLHKFYNGDSKQTIEYCNKIKLRIERSKFHLENDGNNIIKTFQIAALKAFEERISEDGSVVRLSKIEMSNKDDSIEFIMQHAKYTDQVKSNLVLDWSDHKVSNITTLRDYLKVKYGNSLPPLDCNLLANTIGISCILYFKSGRQYIPYLPKRTKFKPNLNTDISNKTQLAVFDEGGIHVTASGALDFPLALSDPSKLNFYKLFTEDMLRELYEEVGIMESDIKEIVPLALTRELLRGGKPQIFYAGILNDGIREEELKLRRLNAIARAIKNKNEKIEVEKEALSIYNTEQLIKESTQHGLTLEALGNLFYSQEYINKMY